MAYKGTLPSDLWDKYDCEGGQDLLTLDLLVAMDMQDKITEATKQAKKADGKSMVARRKQRQAQRELLSDSEGMDMLRSLGVPIAKRSE